MKDFHYMTYRAPNYLQILGGSINVFNKVAEYAAENSLALTEPLEKELCSDILP